MIVKNEEANLPRALASARGLDAELVVVDTGSSDRTVDLARAAGARVVQFAWIDDFSAARNFGFAQARGEWLLVLDADEELTEALRAGLAGVLAKTTADALRVPVASVDDHGALKMRASSTRLIRNGKRYAYAGRVHEDIEGSVREGGGTIEAAELELVHHGYTSSEDVRKDRHARNMQLVVRSHEAAPHEPRHWHYLGLQHAIGGDFERAAPWFERVIHEQPTHELAGWSASQLAGIRLGERALGAAWEAALFGSRARLGGVASLLLLGEITLRDGDPRAALECVTALEKLPARVEGDSEGRREATLRLRARAMAATGTPREAYKLLVRAVKARPEDAGLADELVKMAEHVDPRGHANVTAVKDTQAVASVLAAGIGTFVRRRAFDHAVAMGERHGVRNEHFATALGRVGRRDEARELLASFGDASATHLLVFGLEHADEGAVTRALAALPGRAASAAEHVLAGRPVPHELASWVLGWTELAVALRADVAAERLALALPGTSREARATYALLRHEGGEAADALRIALEVSGEPDALEVIGLVAHEAGDMVASATLLMKRACAGDVSVRVVLRGVAALRLTGNRAGAERLLEIGRESRPHAVSLRASRRA
jgi:hypothetical protein